MKIEKIDIGKLKRNPDNPRIIKDENFKKLVNSIKKFPKMLEIRPIVIDDKGMILGGDKRYLACKELKLKQVPVICASALSPAEKEEFIVKDNLFSGEWDWTKLSGWDTKKLAEWGFEEWMFNEGEKSLAVNKEKEIKKCPKCGYVLK